MLLAIIVAAVLLVDQASKLYIRQAMLLGDSVPVLPGLLHITHVKNSGAAFGILPNQHLLFLIAGIVVIIVMLYYFRQLAVADGLSTVAFGSVLGGATGNLIDRMVFGKVTDFIDFRVWPVFNVADSAIVVGMILLSFILIKDARNEVGHAEQAK